MLFFWSKPHRDEKDTFESFINLLFESCNEIEDEAEKRLLITGGYVSRLNLGTR